MKSTKKQKKKISVAHREQLGNARNELAKSGKSPRMIAYESRLTVLNWIYRWGYTSSALIQEMLGKTSGGYALKLEKLGWLSATKSQSGAPAAFFTLTAQGLEEASRHADELYRYPEVDPFKVRQQLLRHNLLTQKITINALNSKAITSFETDRMFMHEGDKPGEKHPDVVWITDTGLRIAVEVELTAKWERDLDEFVIGIVRALEDASDRSAKYSRFFVFSDSPAIIVRYHKAISPSANLNIWKKNHRHHWVIDQVIPIPEWLIEKVDFRLIER